MKHIFAVLITGIALSISLGSWGRGGVDVGNSGPRARFEVPDFGTEKEMVEHVQLLVPKIENGQLKEVKDLIKRGKCSETEVVFGELEVNPLYRYNKNTGKLEKEFSGEVVVELVGCKRPNRL